MAAVVMTHSGILSAIIEGKAPEAKKPPVGIKQIIVHRQKSTPVIHQMKNPGESSVIRLDFSKESSKQFIEVDDNVRDVGSVTVVDRSDPEYRPAKNKKKLKVLKPFEKPGFKVKGRPGRPKSPRGAHGPVIHNRSTAGFRIPKIGEKPVLPPASPQIGPLDLSKKVSPPPPHNINVVKDRLDIKPDLPGIVVNYVPKVKTLSKQQEKDMEDTIDSVIGQSNDNNKESKYPEYYVSEYKEKKKKKKAPKESKADEWTVSSIKETFSENEDDNDVIRVDSDYEKDNVKKDLSVTNIEENIEKKLDEDKEESEMPPYPLPTTLAPHMLMRMQAEQFTMSSPRPRGRPRGSTMGFYKSIGHRSPMGRKPGRPPLSGKSPGRPPLISRSPGRPPLNRSPGRPPLNRSPGRPPGSGRSPGRPKGSTGLSPKPRGRPRGSKSPRSRGGSPRGAYSNLSFEAVENMDTTDTTESNTKVFSSDTGNEDSGATLFNFPSRSPGHKKSADKEKSSPPASPPRTPTGLGGDRVSFDSSPAPTEPALSRENTPELVSSGNRESSSDVIVSPKGMSMLFIQNIIY